MAPDLHYERRPDLRVRLTGGRGGLLAAKEDCNVTGRVCRIASADYIQEGRYVRKLMVPLCVVALMVLPAAGAMAGVGNGNMQAPPGLQNAIDKIEAAINRQIDQENARFERQSGPLVDALEIALALGDPAAAELQEQLDALTAKHEAKLDKLESKLAEKLQKFSDKIAAWQAKHGIEPDPSGDPTDPPELPPPDDQTGY
jgi:hypothetical protein